MNKKLKKYLSLLLSASILCACIAIGFTALGDDLVAINAINFSDAQFRKVLSEEFDLDEDGYLSAEERDQNIISFSGLLDDNESIKTLDGIEYFASSLRVLRCGGIGLEELDVSSLTGLTSLTCQGNILTSLDVSACTNLVTLDCSDNDLNTLNIGTLAGIQTLFCQINKLTSVNVNALTGLTTFRCDQNELTELNVSRNTQLESFMCAKNHLRELDLSANTLLEGISAYHIGEQTTAVNSTAYNDTIIIYYPLANTARLTTSSLDLPEYPGYKDGFFYAYDVNKIDSGVNYTYATGLENSEDMTVTINVTRDFYQVDFYTSEECTTLAGRRLVNPDTAASAPDIENPQCKVLAQWSADFSSVTEDMSVYPIWQDAHTYSLTAFADGVATIACSGCGESYTVSFVDCINKTSDDEGYCSYLDVVSDGIINAKDYAELTKMF